MPTTSSTCISARSATVRLFAAQHRSAGGSDQHQARRRSRHHLQGHHASQHVAERLRMGSDRPVRRLCGSRSLIAALAVFGAFVFEIFSFMGTRRKEPTTHVSTAPSIKARASHNPDLAAIHLDGPPARRRWVICVMRARRSGSAHLHGSAAEASHRPGDGADQARVGAECSGDDLAAAVGISNAICVAASLAGLSSRSPAWIKPRDDDDIGSEHVDEPPIALPSA